MYINYFQKEIKKLAEAPSTLDIKYLQTFKSNLEDGIQYYQDLIPKLGNETAKYKEKMTEELTELTQKLNDIANDYTAVFNPALQPA